MRHHLTFRMITVLVLAVAFAAWDAPPAWGQTVRRPSRSSSAAVPESPTAEQAATQTKLSRIGEFDGVRWGVDIDFKPDMTCLEALERIREIALAEPYRINILIHGPGIELLVDPRTHTPLPPGAGLREPVTRAPEGLRLRSVSLERALEAALPRGTAIGVLLTGEVLLSSKRVVSKVIDTDLVQVLEPAEPTPADEVRRRLQRRGQVDGRNGSVNLVVREKPLAEAFAELARIAAAEPHQVRIEVAEGALEKETPPVTIIAENVSLARALHLLATAPQRNLYYAIMPEGTVRVLSPDRVHELSYRAERLRLRFDPRSMPQLDSEGRVRGTWGFGWPPEEVESRAALAVQTILREVADDLPGAMAPVGWRFGLARLPQSHTAVTTASGNVSPQADTYLMELLATTQGLEVGPVTGEMVAAAAEFLRKEFRQRHEAGMKWLTDRQASIPKDIAEAEARMAAARQAFDEAAEIVKTFPGWGSQEAVDRLQATVQRLEARIEEARLDLHGKRARIQVISDKIRELGQAAQAEAADDETVKALETVVAIRKDQLERLRRLLAAGRATDADLQAAEIELAQAQLRLAERKEALRDASGGRTVARLNDELVTATVDAAEAEARSKQAEVQLAETRRVPDAIARFNEQRKQITVQESRIASAKNELDWLRENLPAIQPPEVTGLGQVGQ